MRGRVRAPQQLHSVQLGAGRAEVRAALLRTLRRRVEAARRTQPVHGLGRAAGCRWQREPGDSGGCAVAAVRVQAERHRPVWGHHSVPVASVHPARRIRQQRADVAELGPSRGKILVAAGMQGLLLAFTMITGILMLFGVSLPPATLAEPPKGPF